MTPPKEGAIVAVAALAADQIFKNVMLYPLKFVCAQGQPPTVLFHPECSFRDTFPQIEVTPFFDLVMVWNRGISYGLFQTEGLTGTAILVVFSLAAVGALSWWLSTAQHRLLAWGLGLVIGGALGNVIDRLIYQAVADFFRFYAFGYEWYVFNVADAAITIGVVALLVDAFARPEAKNSDREPATRK